MYTMEDILARLQNGEKDTDIADEMVKLLNDAVAAHAKNQKTEERKKAIAKDFVNAIRAYAELTHPEVANDIFADIDEADLVIMGINSLDLTLDTFVSAFGEVQKEGKKEEVKCGDPVKPTGCAKSKCYKMSNEEADRALKSFLELFNW